MKRILLTLSAFVLCMVCIHAQRTVTGTVTDDSGEPLIGATILVKGTSVGTVTEYDGTYSIEVPSGNNTLLISYTGFEARELELGTTNAMDITLSQGITLGTAVITALGIEKEKKQLTYSVETKTGDDLVNARESNIVNALAGKFSGVQVTSSGGQAGSSSRIVIRGASSFLGNNQPLFVVDGVPVDNSQTFGGGQNSSNGTGAGDSPLFYGGTTNRGVDLDPNSIESVSVLKGASATALYGTRAANGVILVTTKKGAKGVKPKISYGINIGASEVRLPPLQDTYAQGLNSVYRSGLPTGTRGSTSWGPRMDTLTLDANGEYDPNGTLAPKYDNAKDFFRTGRTLDHNFSISGGTDNSSYFFSYSRKDEEGIIRNNDFTRNNFLVNFTSSLSDKLKMSTSINYVRSDLTNSTEGNGRQSFAWTVFPAPVSYNLQGSGTDDYFNSNGTQRLYRTSRNNPYFLVDNNGLESVVNRFIPNLSLDYQFNDWLTLSNRLGADIYTDNRDYVEVNGTIGTFPTGRVYKDVNEYRQINNDLILTATHSIEHFDFDFLVGNQINDIYSERQFTQGVGLSVPEFENISNASSLTASEQVVQTRLVGVYAQANIGFDKWAYLTLTGRNDWTSTLPTNQNSFFYPSVSGSFILTEAISGLQSHPTWSFIKLRVGWAQVGNGAPAYATQEDLYVQSSVGDGQRGTINSPFNGQNGFTVGNVVGNPDLKHELTSEIETGLEVQLFNGRLKFEGSYYNRLTEDQIFQAPVAASVGAVSRLVNAGSMRNKGFELLLEGTPLKIGGFEWSLGATFTKNENSVEELTEGVTNIRLGGFTSPGIYIVQDQGYGVIWGTRYQRDDQGRVLIDDDPTSFTYGLPSALDANLGVIGNTQPDWLANLRTGFSFSTDNFGTIGLSGILDIREGGDILNLDNFYMNFYGVTEASEQREGLYTNPNDPSQGVTGDKIVFPNGVLSDGSANNIEVPLNETYWRSNWGFAQEDWVEDGSYIRLREVTLSYDLPSSVVSNTPLHALGIRVTGRNLFLDAPNFSGSDPETSLYGNANGQGFYNFITPGSKSWNVAINVTF